MKKIKRFLLICSGADLELLQRSECRVDQDKYVGIGLTVLMTGLFASLSGGYALFTIFQAVIPSSFFGLLWGGMVFNIDRSIVQSLRKTKDPQNQIVFVLPRLLLAVMISFTVSKPLELKMFEKEIVAEMEAQNLRSKAQAEDKATEAFPQISKLEKENERSLQQINDLEKRQALLYNNSIAEAEGTGGTKKEGKGPVYAENKAELERFESRNSPKLVSLEKRIEENNTQLTRLTRISHERR